ncbi:MAG: hypothetical protein ACI8ZM_003383 [Crocinitomix sp.]|jgi:hypothetical protein
MDPNLELEELENDQPAHSSQEHDAVVSKAKPIIIIAAVAGLVGFVLPWLKLSIFGFSVYSINGYDIPITAESIGYWSIYIGGSSNGVTLLYLLYLIPLLFTLIIGLELLKKRRWIALVGFSILILLSVFLGGLIYNIGFNEALNLMSAGIYTTLIAAIVLVYSNKL